MSAPISKSQLAFQLPNLSYIDAKWEEPNLRADYRAPQHGLKAWLAARFSALRAWRRQQVAMAELKTMTDGELHDIGLSRSDLGRVFSPDHNRDLVQRGSAA